MGATPSYADPLPKIELHVHLEGTVLPTTLLAIARRNRLALPAETPEELARCYDFRDFAHFLSIWELTTNCLRHAEDFRQVVVDYAARAAAHGAVYLEAIFSPGERVQRGVRLEELFEGYCDGAQQAEEDHGVVVRLTPDLHWGLDPDLALAVARAALAYSSRGIVGLGIGGAEGAVPVNEYRRAFLIARDGGLASVPHAGESGGPESVRAVLEHLGADRIRHGIRAIEDEALVAELAERAVVLDVCPTSNLRTGVVRDLAAHPLVRLQQAGVRCSLATDDPAMFGTDLAAEHELAAEMGADLRGLYEAGVLGTRGGEALRQHLADLGATARWPAPRPTIG